MAKRKSAYVCNECGSDHANWQGQCKDCKAWNSLSEIFLSSTKANPSAAMRDSLTDSLKGYAGNKTDITLLSQVDLSDLPRIKTGVEELDRVLGGGLVPGSSVLVGGQPGAGKSTLLLQVMCSLAEKLTALYVTGEESLQQVAMRADRLGLPRNKLHMLAETNVETIVNKAQTLKPHLIVVDSIQVMNSSEIPSAPGGVAQVKECTAYLLRFAKLTNTVLLLVGHVTKDGSLAGPKVLEHMIDTSILLDSSSDSRFRTLRGTKNRFGAVNELGIFAMTGQGMVEVKNPSAIFLNRSEDQAAGSLVMVVWEGTRPLLVEVQALVDDSNLGNPRRVAVGLDQNRLSMLLAVLHRHGGIHVGDQDVFVNVVGGVKVSETAADLALLLAVVSSFRDKVLPKELIVFGEVGLSGEIRPVPSGQERLHEAAKHGFTKAIVPQSNMPKEKIKGMEVIGVKKLSQALEHI
jgi:DNA repair protein RadA/Sms